MSQQEMDYSEMNRGNSGFSYDAYEEAHRYNRYDKLSAPLRASLTAAQRLILALASLVMIMIMTFGLIWTAIATHAPLWVILPILLVLGMFTTAAVIINIVFNRRP
jgi:hypothetical protein